MSSSSEAALLLVRARRRDGSVRLSKAVACSAEVCHGRVRSSETYGGSRDGLAITGMYIDACDESSDRARASLTIFAARRD